ncbi:MAG: hypothetical protein ACODAU_04915 [Myxococcota bacterium]
MRIAHALALALLLAGCRPPAEHPPSGTAAAGEAEAPAEPAPGDAPASARRALGPAPTFADVVQAARALDEAGAEEAQATCLLRAPDRAGGAWRLEADLAVAIRPLPTPPQELAERLEGARRPAVVLSRWGRHGPAEDPGVALVTFTHSPPPGDRAVVVVAATKRGTYLRPTSEALQVPADPVPVGELGAALQALPRSVLLVVTAEPALPLPRLRSLFRTFPPEARVALGVALAPEVKLPQGLEERLEVPEPCAEGLPPLQEAADTEPAELTPDQARDVLGPFAEDARWCISAFPEAAAGGTLEVHLRVAADGSIKDACVARDTVGSPLARRCLLERVRALQFPSPGATVDLTFPLTIDPAPGAKQTPICEQR